MAFDLMGFSYKLVNSEHNKYITRDYGNYNFS